MNAEQYELYLKDSKGMTPLQFVQKTLEYKLGKKIYCNAYLLYT